MTLQADLDHLRSLGRELYDLAGEAKNLSMTSGQGMAALPARPPWEKAFNEASTIARDIVDGALIPGIRERLSETGDVMINVAQQFAAGDNPNEHDVASTYTNATGEWAVDEAP